MPSSLRSTLLDRFMASLPGHLRYVDTANDEGLLKLVTKDNNNLEVTEVPELGSKLRTWLQRMCCALAR